MKTYELTDEELRDVLDACKPQPYLVFGGMGPSSPQERANLAWELLGKKHGFDAFTVQGIPGKSERYFTAEPVESKP